MNIMRNRKSTIRLTESELKKVITESVRRVLREMDELSNYYLCIEDGYGSEITFWVGDENDAKDYSQSAGCDIIGPMPLADAEEYAKRLNAMDYRTQEQWVRKLRDEYVSPWEEDEEDNFYEHYNSYAVNGESDFYDDEY